MFFLTDFKSCDQVHSLSLTNVLTDSVMRRPHDQDGGKDWCQTQPTHHSSEICHLSNV